MADQILQRARNALNRSQQFRVNSSEEPIRAYNTNKSMEEQHKIGTAQENLNVNGEISDESSLKVLKIRRPAQTMAKTNEFGLSSAPEIKTPKTPIRSGKLSLVNKNIGEETTTSSISMSSTSENEISSKHKHHHRLFKEESSHKSKLVSVPVSPPMSKLNDENFKKPTNILTSLKDTDLDSIKTENSLSESSVIRSISSVRSKSSKKSTTPKIKVQSIISETETTLHEEKLKSSIILSSKTQQQSNMRSQSKDFIKTNSLVEIILENLDATNIIPSEGQTIKSKTNRPSIENHEQEIPEDTLSYISSLKMSSAPQTDEEDEISFKNIEPILTSISNSIPKKTEIQTYLEPEPEVVPKTPPNDISDEISEKIESIIKDLTSVHEILNTQSRTYSSSYIIDNKSSKPINTNEFDEDLSVKYDSSFIEDEDEEDDKFIIPEDADVEKNVSSKHSILNERPSSSSSFQQKEIQPSKKTLHVQHTTTRNKPTKIQHNKIKKKKVIIADPPDSTSTSESINFLEQKYISKRKQKTEPDLSHQVIFNHLGDLPGFCTDLIRNVVDSNERMYKYTMEAAENMTRLYYQRIKNKNKVKHNKTKDRH